MVSAGNSFSVNAYDRLLSWLWCRGSVALTDCAATEFVRARPTDAAGVLANRPVSIWLE